MDGSFLFCLHNLCQVSSLHSYLLQFNFLMQRQQRWIAWRKYAVWMLHWFLDLRKTKGANLPCFKALGRCSTFWVAAAWLSCFCFYWRGCSAETDGLKGEYHADRIGASAGSDQPARYVVDHRRALAVRWHPVNPLHFLCGGFFAARNDFTRLALVTFSDTFYLPPHWQNWQKMLASRRFWW